MMQSLVKGECHLPRPVPQHAILGRAALEFPPSYLHTLSPIFPQSLACSCHHCHPSPTLGLVLICYSVNIDPLNGCHFYIVGTVFILFCSLVLAL